MSWAWLALLPADEQVAPGIGSAAATAPDDPMARRFVAWAAGPRPHAEAVRVHDALLDEHGGPAVVVVQIVAPGAAPLFDDPAVQELTRRLGDSDVGGVRPDAVSTFTRDPVHYAGGMTVHRDRRAPGTIARDSRLRRLAPVQVFAVAPGLFGAVPPPAGPGTQRYSGKPWPARGFA